MKKSENILLLGLGEIGFYLAKRLSMEGHNITAIENDPVVIQKAQEELDIRLIEGNGTDFREWKALIQNGNIITVFEKNVKELKVDKVDSK